MNTPEFFLFFHIIQGVSMQIVSRFILAAAFTGAFFINPVSAQKGSPKADCVDCGSGCTSPECSKKCDMKGEAVSQKAATAQVASVKSAKTAKLLPISIKGMTCKSCVSKVSKALKEAGAQEVRVSLESGLASVVPAKNSNPRDLVQAVTKAGFKAQVVPVAVYALSVEGMTCQACASKVSKALSSFPAAYKVKVDVQKGRAVVMGPKGFLKPENLAKAVNATKFKARPLATTTHCLDLKALGKHENLAKELKTMDGVLSAKIFSKFGHACVTTLADKETSAAFAKTFGKAVRPACTGKSCDASKKTDCDAASKAKGSCSSKAKGSCGAKTKQ